MSFINFIYTDEFVNNFQNWIGQKWIFKIETFFYFQELKENFQELIPENFLFSGIKISLVKKYKIELTIF